MSATTHHPLTPATDPTSEGAALGHPETHQEASPAPHAALEAVLVPPAEHAEFLAALFGARVFWFAELQVYDWLRDLCSDYDGGVWDFFRVGSNGAGYLAPAIDDPLALSVSGNGFEGQMSAQAAGIVATLFTLSDLSFTARGDEQELVVNRYHALREFALDHPEARAIFAAID